ncbi:MAG: molybdopterin-guanine dinucleotide biosynthesis protein B [Stellaceae bacterium]
MPRLFGLAGWSGSGKTTLLEKLVPVLTARGLAVSTVKHAHHDFDLDRPGKDSWRHRQAGAREVMVASARRWALVHELRGAAEPTLDQLVAAMSPVDLVLIEGFKREPYPKLEIHRAGLGKPLIAPTDSDIVAIATDLVLDGIALPRLDLADVGAIAGFIIDYCGLAPRRAKS